MSRPLPELRPLDLVFFDKRGTWIDSVIDWIERTPGEEPTRTSHNGAIQLAGAFVRAFIIEALRRGVVSRSMSERILDGYPAMEVWRMTDPAVTPEQREAILQRLRSRVGAKYGRMRLILFLVDGLIGKLRRRRTYWARRIGRLGTYEVCSELILDAWRVGGLDFATGAGDSPSPDDLLDFIEAHPEKYERIYGPMKRPVAPQRPRERQSGD